MGSKGAKEPRHSETKQLESATSIVALVDQTNTAVSAVLRVSVVPDGVFYPLT